MERKPVVLIAPEDVNDAFGNVFIMEKEYGRCIREAGGVPMGAGDFRAVETYAEYADALLIPGGPDIHMARYGQYFTDSSEIASFSNTRDDLDFALCEAFLKAKKPVFGIGRGAQVINVALGGTLIRNIKPHLTADCGVTDFFGNTYSVLDGTPGVFTHKNGVHKITLEQNSRLAKVLGTETMVNSFHHQAAYKLGEGLRAAAYSEDGVIEAFEHEFMPVIGIQWHPEHESDGFQRDVSVFRMFVSMIGEGGHHA